MSKRPHSQDHSSSSEPDSTTNGDGADSPPAQNPAKMRRTKLNGEASSSSECSHTIVFKDMCTSCGKDLRVKGGLPGQRMEESAANVAMIHHVPELVVSSELANEFGDRDQQNLLNSRKLILLCDLDNTLIHTSDRPPKPNEVTPDVKGYQDQFGKCLYTKIRPNAERFIERMSKLFELSVVTYGQRVYAHTIARLLDPSEMCFGHRILSRNELYSMRDKSLNIKSIFPCSEELVVMIDDRPEVWMHSDALIKVKPYLYFSDVGDINAPPTLPKPESKNGSNSVPPVSAESVEMVEEEKKTQRDLSDPLPTVVDSDNTLEFVERILVNVHTHFYQYYDKENKIQDVKKIVAWLRAQVLSSERIVLSGMVPVGIDIRAWEHYRTCRQFGAEIEENVNESTTVVIAARPGTEKIRQAQKRGIPVVTTKWLDACLERWQMVDKKDFILEEDEAPIPAPRGPKPLFSTAEQKAGNLLGLDNISQMETISTADLRRMSDEVDSALSEDSDEDEENSHQSSSYSYLEQEKEESTDEENAVCDYGEGPSEMVDNEESQEAKSHSSANRSSASSNSSKIATSDEDDFEEMAADLEHQLNPSDRDEDI